MAKKKKSYGKTAKQWDNLYKRFTNSLKNERVEKYTKTEFKQVWTNRKPGETLSDIVKNLRKDKWLQYELKYKHETGKGFNLSRKLSKEAFSENLEEYEKVSTIIEFQREKSKKQAKKEAAYLEKMSKTDYERFKDLKYKDFLYDEFYEDNPLLSESRKKYIKERLALVKEFEDFIDENDLWDEVFSYGG